MPSIEVLIGLNVKAKYSGMTSRIVIWVFIT